MKLINKREVFDKLDDKTRWYDTSYRGRNILMKSKVTLRPKILVVPEKYQIFIDGELLNVLKDNFDLTDYTAKDYLIGWARDRFNVKIHDVFYVDSSVHWDRIV